MAYVKYSDVSDSLAPLIAAINGDDDPRTRSESVKALISAASKEISLLLEKTCYDLKALGEPTDKISIDLGISQRAVLRIIRRFAKTNDLPNPMDRVRIDSWFDIRDYLDLGEERTHHHQEEADAPDQT
jgi:hypothetical protein